MAKFDMIGLTPDEFSRFEDEGYSDEDALEMAQGLVRDAIPCIDTLVSSDILSTGDLKQLKYAVFEMAKYIKNDFDNFDRATSPFQSESIGSYTYNRLSQSVANKETTGIPAFDRAVSRLLVLCDSDTAGGMFSSTTETVFKPGFDNYISGREGRRNVAYITPRILGGA